MKTFTLTIIENETFQDGFDIEIASILKHIADKNIAGNKHFSEGRGQPIRDCKGVEIGYFNVYGVNR